MTQDQIQTKYQEILNVLKVGQVKNPYQKEKNPYQYHDRVLAFLIKELPKIVNISERKIKVMKSKNYKTIWDEADYLIKFYIQSKRKENAI